MKTWTICEDIQCNSSSYFSALSCTIYPQGEYSSRSTRTSSESRDLCLPSQRKWKRIRKSMFLESPKTLLIDRKVCLLRFIHSLYLIREKKKTFTLSFLSQCQCYRQKGLQVDNFFPLDFLTMIHRIVLLPGTCFNRNGKQVSLRMAVSILDSNKFKWLFFRVGLKSLPFDLGKLVASFFNF